MKLRTIISIIIIVFSCSTFAQNNNLTRKIIVSNKDNYERFEVTEVGNSTSKHEKVRNDLSYFWYYDNGVHSTMGGYSGKLVHGQYEAFYFGNALKYKGNFIRGLKDGLWKEWYRNGRLKAIERWNKGQLDGIIEHYDSLSVLTDKMKYSNGKLNGISLLYDNGQPFKKVKYRNDIIKKQILIEKKVPLSEDSIKAIKEKKQQDKQLKKQQKEQIKKEKLLKKQQLKKEEKKIKNSTKKEPNKDITKKKGNSKQKPDTNVKDKSGNKTKIPFYQKFLNLFKKSGKQQSN